MTLPITCLPPAAGHNRRRASSRRSPACSAHPRRPISRPSSCSKPSTNAPLTSAWPAGSASKCPPSPAGQASRRRRVSSATALLRCPPDGPGPLRRRQMIRRHRLIELFLATTLGSAGTKSTPAPRCSKHAFSDDIIDRIDERLGRPQFDPHGQPIRARTARPRGSKASRSAKCHAAVVACRRGSTTVTPICCAA